ncbi:MAG: hypothetical protein RAO92_04160 [Candidatus Euphemobacter frigidus]|nr:hypothetical protein [Candidatus Euphemobacter frigidus]MDP8275579.1 hypothetical protein [Candidatus Euphemobacter frigidus]
MDKKKKEKIFIIVLIPVLAFVLYNSLSTVSKKKKSAGQKTEVEAQTQAPAAATVEVSTKPVAAKSDWGVLPPLNEKLVRMQNTIADEPWGRDPFQPPPVTKNDKQSSDWKDFTLSGVIPGRAATINGAIVGVGEEFEGYLLIKVGNYGITLEKDGQSYILTMPED